MGIRIHKFLGYGLTDVENDGYWPTDPRINAKVLSDLMWDQSSKEYIEWLDQKYTDADIVRGEWNLDRFIVRDYGEEKLKDFSFSDCFAYQGEYGMPNVLVLKPLSMNDWSRFDDAIDYMAETHLYSSLTDPQANRIDSFGLHGLYPWSSIYMDARTGDRLQDGILWVRLFWDPPPPDGAKLAVAKHLGFENVEEAEANITPVVPVEVRDVAEFAGLFTSDDVWLQLKPMLYTYWA